MKVKKQYLSPRMKVMKVQQTQIICASSLESKSQNENYEVVDETTTSGWFK